MQSFKLPETDLDDDGEAGASAPPGLKRWTKLLPLAVVALGLVLVFATGLNRYLSLEMLQARRLQLLAQVHAHPVAGVLVYMLAYVAVVAFSIPGAMIMTMAGGFLFGPVLGTLAAVTGASTGATLMFLVARSALGDLLKRYAQGGGMLARIEIGVRTNAFSYLLVLRLIPAVPFWLINIASGFVRIRLKTYVIATVLGILPSTFIYSNIGAGLGHVFDRGETPDLSLLFDPQVYLPLFGLAFLSLAPLLFHAWRMRRQASLTDAAQ
jgi:uncharacterized membrane protein YdjX (TVP38/TMEM64 family)